MNRVGGMIGSALDFTPGANVEIPDSDSLRDMAEYTISIGKRNRNCIIPVPVG